MSARVLNPVMLTEFYKITSPSMMRRNLPSNRKLNTIKKDLFGSPNPNETKRIFEDELEKHQDIACKKWGFDFRNGYPIVGNNQFIWERVTFNDFIPEMYTLTRAAHIRQLPIDLETNSDDILIDARAAKENELSSSNLGLDLLNSDGDDNGISAEEDDDDDDVEPSPPRLIFKVPIDGQHSRLVAAAAAAACNQLRKKRRQPKITEYMKERKRLAPTPKKMMISPIKRMRMSNNSIIPTSSTTTTSSTGKRINSPGKRNLFSSGGRYQRN